MAAILLGFCLAAPASCQTTEEKQRANVPEDINRDFLDPDADPQEWIDRFEVESREIYAARERIVAALGLRPGMRVADIGCGTGLFEPLLAAAVGLKGRVYAVDISRVLLDFVRDRCEKLELRQVEFVLCEDDNVCLKSGSVDLAFVCDTYHHFEYPEATLQSLRWAIRPGGELVVIDFERIPGVSREWVLSHVRAGKDEFRREIERAGFIFVEEVSIPEFKESYFLRFRRP